MLKHMFPKRMFPKHVFPKRMFPQRMFPQRMIKKLYKYFYLWCINYFLPKHEAIDVKHFIEDSNEREMYMNTPYFIDRCIDATTTQEYNLLQKYLYKYEATNREFNLRIDAYLTAVRRKSEDHFEL